MDPWKIIGKSSMDPWEIISTFSMNNIHRESRDDPVLGKSQSIKLHNV